MNKLYSRPAVGVVKIKDSFWTPYLENIRDILIPYCFQKFEETGYISNFRNVAENNGKSHIGPPFSDGLLLETIRGACDFLKAHYDKKTDDFLDGLIETVISAQQKDGFLSTYTLQKCPAQRWGENDGDIIHQHDLYNHGALIEAAISHYLATGKTKLLIAAVKSSKLICSYMGKPPKHNIIPGHSLPEEAFVKLYRLFRDTRSLDGLREEYGVNYGDFLEIARFWYDNRGNHQNRTLSKNPLHAPHYNQDTAPFSEQKNAMGHAVRACLCYNGAAAVAYEADLYEYKAALDAIWNDVTRKKLHISGGVGSRHDIEGFDKEYDLPNNAYLETCAGTALAFWAGEMSLLERKSEYYDYFELSLYNNILGSVGNDFRSFYYDNALINDGTKNRWSWHVCPCCPPMLAKFYSALSSYIYSFGTDEICVNMYIGSEYTDSNFSVCQSEGSIDIDTHKDITLYLRIPAYADEFRVRVNGKYVEFSCKCGYAEIAISKGTSKIDVSFEEKTRKIFADSKVEADRGRVCVMKGKYLMCVEGIDNNGNTEQILANNSTLTVCGENIITKSKDGSDIMFIPYWKRNNRVGENPEDSKMAVWLLQDGYKVQETAVGELYGEYQG